MKKYRTEKEWEFLIDEQINSGLNVTTFCKQKGIHPNHFYRKRTEINTDEDSLVKLDIPKQTNSNLFQDNTLIRIGSIEISPGNNTDQQQLCRIFCSALEAVNAQL